MQKDLKQIVDAALSRALENHLPPLREELVKRVLEEIGPQLAPRDSVAASSNGSGHLLDAVMSIQAGSTQKEILRALLGAGVHYCGRAALFVIKSGAATGWQGRGFANDEEVKDFSLDVTSGAAEKVLETRTAVTCPTGELDAKFISTFGAPAEDQISLLPLRLRDKVAALVYADGGTEPPHKVDHASLQLLVASAGAWLELISLRRQAQKDGFAEGAETQSETAVAAQTVASYSDPFAGHAPAYASANAAPVMESVAAVATASGAGAAVAPAADPFAQMSPADAEVHRKAQRFARLLIDEIKLYNQAKVAEGRKNKDLYGRLKEDIEKSRATYQKRYGQTAAGSANYINQEILRSLAEDDISVMGPNFHA